MQPINPVPLKWTSDVVSKFWNGCAKTRLMDCSFGKLAAESLLLAIWKHLPESGSILDYGAGDGDLVTHLLANGLKAAAYEPSENRRESILKKCGTYTNFLGVVDENSDQKYDVVFMCEVIEHLLDTEINSELSRLSRFLKPGGILIITTPHAEDLELGMCYCPNCNSKFHRWQHVRSFDTETLVTTISRIGVDPIVIHYTEFNSELFVPYRDYLSGLKDLPVCNEDNDENRTFFSEYIRRIHAAIDALLDKKKILIPEYIYKINKNESTRIGRFSHILYVGKKLK